MADNVGSKVSYFLVGLGVGALMGVLFAPKSGEDTREYLAKRADDGREFAQKKAKELRERLGTLRDAGYDQFVIQLVPGHESALDDWARLFEKAA